MLQFVAFVTVVLSVVLLVSSFTSSLFYKSGDIHRLLASRVSAVSEYQCTNVLPTLIFILVITYIYVYIIYNRVFM